MELFKTFLSVTKSRSKWNKKKNSVLRKGSEFTKFCKTYLLNRKLQQNIH